MPVKSAALDHRRYQGYLHSATLLAHALVAQIITDKYQDLDPEDYLIEVIKRLPATEATPYNLVCNNAFK